MQAEPCKCPTVTFGSLPKHLYLAAWTGNLKEVREYVEKTGRDVNAADDDGYTMLAGACVGGQVQVVRYLHRHPLLHRNNPDWGSFTPLMHAATQGHTNVVKELIATPHKCTLDLQANNNGETALKLAQSEKHEEIVKLLETAKLPMFSAPTNSLEIVPAHHGLIYRKLECQVCLENYDVGERRPRILGCGHSFCSSCLTLLLEDGPITCPCCRMPQKHFRDINQIPVNYEVAHLVEDQLARAYD